MINDLAETGVQQRDAEVRANKYFSSKFGRTLSSYIALGKYQSPPKIHNDVSSLKVMLLQLGDSIGINVKYNELTSDKESAYCKEVAFHFGRIHIKQMLETTYRSYEDPKDDDHLIQTYERLTKLAIKDHPLSSKSNRFMKLDTFSCKLLSADKWEEIVLWKPLPSEGEDEIYSTIEAAVGGKVDSLLKMESKWMEIDSTERMEEVIERASVQYVEANLMHKLPVVSEIEPEADKPDFSPIEFLKATTRIDIEEPASEQKKSGLKQLAKAYISERVLLMREYKRKLSHALNYFASVKKKLIQDAIELGTRHTVTEAKTQLKTMNQIAQQKLLKRTQINQTKPTLVPPSIFHADSGHPMTFKSDSETFDEEIARKRASPLFKMVYIAEDEVRLIDSNGVYVFLKAALKDLDDMFIRLMNCGTYYISQYEIRYGLFCKNYKPYIDRASVLLDLLSEESQFQYAKLEVVSKLLYIYDHTSDFSEMQAVGQEIYNFISRRPRLQLASEYFRGAYQMETQCMRSYAELLTTVIARQVKEELKVNESVNRAIVKRMGDYEKMLQRTSGTCAEAEEILKIQPIRKNDLSKEEAKIELDNKNIKELFEFISFEEGWHFSLDEPTFEYLNDDALPKYKIGTFHSSLAEVAYVFASIQHALKYMETYYKPESSFAVSALECELVVQTGMEYKSLLDFPMNPPKAIEPELKSIEIDSVSDLPYILIDTVRDLIKDLNKGNAYEIKPTYLGKLSPAFLKKVDFSYFQKDDTRNAPRLETSPSSCIALLCNLVDWVRLREDLINALYETYIVTEVYKSQQQLISNNSSSSLSEPVIPSKPANQYVSPVICSDCHLNFAVKEFNPEFQFLLCFHSNDCIKLAVFESGLEELRGALHYQKMHLQLLQIAVQTNHWMYLPYIRAFAELDSAMGKFVASSNKKRRSFTVPNGILPLKAGEDIKIYLNEEEKIVKKLAKSIADCFIEIQPVKNSSCEFVRAAYSEFSKQLQHSKSDKHNEVSMARSLKAYSIYLLHKYCDQTLNRFYVLSLHSHIFVVANSLRQLQRLFPSNEQLFECKRSYGLEFAPFSSELSLKLDRFQDIEFNMENTSLRIPSTEDIAMMIKSAQKAVAPSKPQVTYEFDEERPESLMVQHLPAKEDLHKVLKSSPIYAIASKLSLLQEIVTLELASELPHIPLDLWLKMIKNEKVDVLIWHSLIIQSAVLLTKGNNENHLEVAIREKVEEEHNLQLVKYILKNVTNRLKTMDLTLHKTFKYKPDEVLRYLKLYSKVFMNCNFSTSTCV